MPIADVQTATENLAAALANLSDATNAVNGAQVAFSDAQAALVTASDNQANAFQDAGRKLAKLIADAAAAGVTPIDEPDAPVEAQALRLPKLPPIKDILAAVAKAEQAADQIRKLLAAISGTFAQG